MRTADDRRKPCRTSVYKDEADVDEILRTNPRLDETYLRKWLDEWGVRERYERIARRGRPS